MFNILHNGDNDSNDSRSKERKTRGKPDPSEPIIEDTPPGLKQFQQQNQLQDAQLNKIAAKFERNYEERIVDKRKSSKVVRKAMINLPDLDDDNEPKFPIQEFLSASSNLEENQVIERFSEKLRQSSNSSRPKEARFQIGENESSQYPLNESLPNEIDVESGPKNPLAYD